MDALSILGLNLNYSTGDLKKAYRRKAMEYHPDRSKGVMDNHLAMIRLNHAYNELLSHLEQPAEPKAEPQVADPYVDYRRGMELLRSVHPNRWKKINGQDLYNAHAIETDPRALEIIQELIERLSTAYHYFSRVVNLYPENSWTKDARSRVDEIERRTVLYHKILRSYEEEKP